MTFLPPSGPSRGRRHGGATCTPANRNEGPVAEGAGGAARAGGGADPPGRPAGRAIFQPSSQRAYTLQTRPFPSVPCPIRPTAPDGVDGDDGEPAVALRRHLDPLDCPLAPHEFVRIEQCHEASASLRFQPSVSRFTISMTASAASEVIRTDCRLGNLLTSAAPTRGVEAGLVCGWHPERSTGSYRRGRSGDQGVRKRELTHDRSP
jgi:hypothetical protein